MTLPEVLQGSVIESAVPEGATFNETNLRLPEDLGVAKWSALGAVLGRFYRSSGWWLCDWIAYGERSYDGQMFDQYVDACGLSPKTIKNLRYTALSVDPSRRRDPSTTGLSIAHHSEVASLPDTEQDEWLDKAEENGWTQKELRNRLRESKQPTPANVETIEKMACPHCGEVFAMKDARVWTEQA